MDLASLTDEELDAMRRSVAVEQERRARLASIPGQIEALVKTYTDGGGNVDDLRGRIEPVTP